MVPGRDSFTTIFTTGSTRELWRREVTYAMLSGQVIFIVDLKKTGVLAERFWRHDHEL